MLMRLLDYMTRPTKVYLLIRVNPPATRDHDSMTAQEGWVPWLALTIPCVVLSA